MMSNDSDGVILKRILAHFGQMALLRSGGERRAPLVRDELDKHMVDHYDSDFYLEALGSDFDDVEESRLRRIVFEHIEEINTVFFNGPPVAGD